MEVDLLSNNFLTSFNSPIAQSGNKVFKDECIFCFNSTSSPGGINVCLANWYGVCAQHLKLFVKIFKERVFLNIHKIPREVEEVNDPPEKKPTRMAIGVEGGFDVEKNKTEYDDINSLIITDSVGNIEKKYMLPEPNLPQQIQISIAAIIAHQGAALIDEIKTWEEKRNVSKFAENLQQLNNGVKIPPSGWKCSRCDLTQNLWLNLTCGTILCGRRYFDGSGGNNHAVEYYNETKYPLAVKLGTITSTGGDVFSYSEDDMVEDPKLKEHLLHFGINIALMEKTDKTMTELEIEANLSLKAEWDTIQESGKKLTPLHGPGYTGMINLGNSCYMNSVMQVIFSMEEFQNIYFNQRNQILDTLTSDQDPSKDFNIQMSKLADGILSGRYSIPMEDDDDQETMGVRPQMFKTLIGQDHVDFSTNQQQDAQDFFLHLMDFIEKKSSLKELFEFQYEDRIQCLTSNKVSYIKRDDISLNLPIPLEAATNKVEYEKFEERKKAAKENNERLDNDEVVRLNIPMTSCWESFASEEIVTDFYSNAIKGKSIAKKTVKLKSFPEYLMIQLRKFTINEDWTPKKLDVSVDILEELDLSHLRSFGKQPHEEEQPSADDSMNEETAFTFNEQYLSQLMEMGFSLAACQKAVYNTKNAGMEAAMNWVFEHSQDADFETPFEIPKKTSKSKGANQGDIDQIVALGFNKIQATNALLQCKNNVEQSLELLFEHPEQVNALQLDEESNKKEEKQYKDGPEKYRLFGFISHMGTSTSCGHYVCHIKKDGRWVIYNDRKVALSEQPPINLGYLYLYKRIRS